MKILPPERSFPGRLKFAILMGIFLAGCLCAEPQIWKSTSGSTIEALFLGAFGDDYWFEASDDGRFMKMPSKYISEADRKMIESGKAKGTLPPELCDRDPASIRLLELIYTQAARAPGPEVTRLDEAVEQLISPLQPKDAEKEAIKVSFTKRKYKKTPLPERPEKGTIFEVLEQLLGPHELRLRIREGGLEIGRD